MDMNIADAVRTICDKGCLDTLGVFRDWLREQDSYDRQKQYERLNDAFGELVQAAWVVSAYKEFARQLRIIFWQDLMTFDQAKAHILKELEDYNAARNAPSSAFPSSVSSKSSSPYAGWQPAIDPALEAVQVTAFDNGAAPQLRMVYVCAQCNAQSDRPTDESTGLCEQCFQLHHGQCEE